MLKLEGGYGTEIKAYHSYDVKQEKVLFSHDVVFDETKKGTEKEFPEDQPSDSGHV